MQKIEAGLRWVLGAVSIAFLAVFLYVALRRSVYPYELEWMEGAMVDHVERILRGQRLYVQPSLEFVPFIYGPVYFYLSAVVAKVTGVGFLPLRLVSIAGSVGSFYLLYRLVERETRDRLAGIVAAGAFAASYMRSAQFLDIARVDALALFFGLCGIYVVRHHAKTIAGQLGAAALLGLSFMTKQSMLFVALAMIAWMAKEHRRKAVPFAVATLVATLGSFWLMDWMHDGWLRYYLWELPQAHPRVPSAWLGFWSDDLFPVYGIAGAFGLYYLIAAKERSTAIFFLLASGALTGGAWSGRLHDGGWPNVLIPAFAALSLLLGFGLAEAFARLEDVKVRQSLCAVALLQLLALAFDAKRTLPHPGDRELGDAFIARLRAIPGDVWIPHHAWYSRLAGKRAFAHKMAIDDVLRGDSHGEGLLLLIQIRRAIDTKRFGAIVLDDDFFENEIGRNYELSYPQPFPLNVGFFAPTGIHVRPKALYLRRS